MIYLAVDTDTGDIKGFTYWGDLVRFAKENEYQYEYYELRNPAPLYLSEMLSEGEEQ